MRWPPIERKWATDMSILVIGPQEEAEIAAAIKRARENPVPLDVARRYAVKGEGVKLADRKPGTDEMRQIYQPQMVMLGTYRAMFSFEEQAFGLCRHLSVSSQAKGKVPGPEVMQMVCEAFGFSGLPLQHPGKIWVEEFEPGRHAVNFVELDA